MSPTSDDPTPGTGGARIRAKARVNPRVRPEVADALGGLERSLVDVATWERLQPSPIPEAGEEPLDGDDQGDDDDLPELVDDIPVVLDDGIPPPPGADGVPPELRVALDPAVQPGGGSPLLTEFVGEAALEELRPAPPVLPGAATIAQGTTQSEEEAAEAQRRRRNGRVLTWAGVVVLVSVGAMLVFTRDSDDGTSQDELPAVTQRSTTTFDTLLLNPSDLTTTSTIEVTTTTTVAETTTTAKSSGSGSKSTTTTKKPTTTTTTRTPTSQPPIVTPGTGDTVVRPVTTTTRPPVTTTTAG